MDTKGLLYHNVGKAEVMEPSFGLVKYEGGTISGKVMGRCTIAIFDVYTTAN